ncbi:MAG: hypothetical protein DI623_13725 [Sphingomonas sanxanigenens]|uniref:Ner winged helix-turn-helix DNA-binding domain-containing protein n=1 Tax=Sphingomonas sanxanigenens TaxID=397260 RepID=A0A2W5A3L7_9SPHN|nr:MAG: hypothetical protein DI623_13725 [Sphingomonas sanxanigenens]
MLVDGMHREDIKAIIRKRYRSIGAFERAEGLAKQSVSEIFRGRPSARTKAAIERVLREALEKQESIVSVDSSLSNDAHRLNAAAH